MNADEVQAKEFEQRASAVLEGSITRVNARVRSRLTQARHAALEEIATGRRSSWHGPMLMPATGVVAAVALVALVLSAHFRTSHTVSPADGSQAAFEDIELLADSDGLDLVENWDSGFYEWAAGQSDDADGTSG
jgi:anti-sigma-K factor RskA